MQIGAKSEQINYKIGMVIPIFVEIGAKYVHFFIYIQVKYGCTDFIQISNILLF